MTLKMALPLILIAYLNSAYGVPTDTYRTDKGVICYLCPPGKFFVGDCSLDYDSAVCSPCPNGHYIGFNNQAYKCQPCSTVCPNTNYESFDDQPEIITANCTSISDIVCECKLGFWRESGYRGMCRRAKKCKEGYGVSAQATGYSDTICEACETGQTFSNTTSAADACLPCSKCYDHTYIRNDCRTDRDTECILLTTTEFTTRKDASRELQQGLGLGVGIPVLVACGLILVFCFIRRKRTKRQQNIPAKTVPDGQLSSSNITHIETLHLRPTSNVASIHTFNGQHVWSTSTYLPDLNDSIWSEGYPTSVEDSKSKCRDTVTPRNGHLKKDDDDTLTQVMMGIYHQAMESVGAIVRSGRTIGTGFRVGPKYILTALHVVTKIIDPRQCGKKDCRKLKEASIVFNSSPNISPARDYHFDTKLYFSDTDLDICILKIIDDDGLMPRKLSLRKEPLVGVNVDFVSLIGYGNQDNMSKHFEYKCPIVRNGSTAVNSALDFSRQNIDLFKNGVLVQYPTSVVDHGYQGHDAPHNLLVHCYMENGASGAPMLACLDQSAGIVEVVGVLTHGIPEFYFCLDEETKRHLPNKYRFEAGTRVSSIYEHMINQRNRIAHGIVEDLFV